MYKNRKVYDELTELFTFRFQKSALKALQETKTFIDTHPVLQAHDKEHSLRVAVMIANWNFDINTILSAMLIDHSSAINSFSSESRDIDLEKITTILNSIWDFDSCLQINRVNNESLDLMDPDTLYIIIARQLDLMEKSDHQDCKLTEREKMELANQSFNIFLPKLTALHTYYLVDQFQDAIMKIKQTPIYAPISKRISEIRRDNRKSIETTINLFKIIFRDGSKITEKYKSLNQVREYVSGLYVKSRAICSIYRSIEKSGQHYSSINYERELTKYNTALYELTLVLKDTISTSVSITPIQVFMVYYENYLHPVWGIRLISYNRTTGFQDGFQAGYLLIADDNYNLFRLFIKTEQNYRYYKIGSLIDSKQFYQSKTHSIKVFLRDGTPKQIPENSTVLDLAFFIHRSLGIHYYDANINNLKVMGVSGKKNSRIEKDASGNLPPINTPPDYVLNEGDLVSISIIPAEERAQLEWFKYIHTDNAKKELIRYFQKKIDKLYELEQENLELKQHILDLEFMFKNNPEIK